jgi:hypothetical protein
MRLSDMKKMLSLILLLSILTVNSETLKCIPIRPDKINLFDGLVTGTTYRVRIEVNGLTNFHGKLTIFQSDNLKTWRSTCVPLSVFSKCSWVEYSEFIEDDPMLPTTTGFFYKATIDYE